MNRTQSYNPMATPRVGSERGVGRTSLIYFICSISTLGREKHYADPSDSRRSSTRWDLLTKTAKSVSGQSAVDFDAQRRGPSSKKDVTCPIALARTSSTHRLNSKTQYNGLVPVGTSYATFPRRVSPCE